MVQLHDVAATCLHLAGASDAQLQTWMPDACDLLVEAALRRRGHAVCAFRNSSVCISDPPAKDRRYDPPIHATMWREGRWKLNVYHTKLPECSPEGPPECPPASPREHSPEGELYDLQTDPMEVSNRWSDPSRRTVRDELRARLDDWLRRHGGRGEGRV
jgi:hypothetical protein